MTKDYWIPLHLHSDETNGTGYFEIANTYKQYLDYYVEHKLPAIAITNHGNNVAWIDHKVLADKVGIKYIGGIEAYVAMTLDRYEEYPNPKKPKEIKKVYDKFHTIIIALNEQGNKEINQLESDSFNRFDGHFHGRPRIEFEDLQAAVKRGNIIVTTACLGGALNHFRKHPEYQAELQQWIDLAINHKDRVFLEVQPHLDKEQTEYNAYLVELAKKYDLKLIASNDIHALNQKYDKLRKIVQLGKSGLEKLPYDNEDTFELWVKTRQEMFDLFKQQGVLTDKQINDALDLTVEIADMVEDFEIDRSVKYPHLYADEEKEFQKRIMEGYKERGIDKLPKEQQQVYLKRIKYEYSVYKKMDSLSYMLAHNDIIKAAHNQGYRNGYGRGSVTGSLIAYLIGTTEVDSIRHNLVFERFMNPARVNLPDIDVDFENEGRNWVQQWLLHNDKFHAASILTLGTAQIRNAIALVAAGLDDYTTVVKGKRITKLNVVESIKNGLNDDDTVPDSLYRAHKELFDWVNMLVGVTMSFGRHAAGIVVDTRTLDDNMGSISLVSDKITYKVSSVTMHDIDYCNWVKFDILGLDNMGLITRTSKMANLPFLTPDRTDIVNFQDEKVWKSLTRDNVGVFQFEGDRAGRLIADMFSDETLAKIKAKVPNIQYLDLMSLTNAGQRPSGASYIDRVVHGEFNNNGHKALDDFLSSTLGFMVYQETQSQFLVDFCGYDFAHADLIRKGIGELLAC